MSSVPRLLRPLAATLALAALAHAADPSAKAFRKAAQQAAHDVRVAANAEVAPALEALHDALAALADDGDLVAAFESAATAITAAAARNASGAAARAAELASEGAALLAGASGEVGRDFLDGGGGAWDDFKARSEARLAKIDALLARRFTAFVRKASKLALADGHDPDARFVVRGRDDLLASVPGPLLADAPTLLATPDARAWIVVDARFLVAPGSVTSVVGAHCGGTGAVTLAITDAAGDTVEAGDLEPDPDGVVVAALPLPAPHASGPVATRLRDASDAELVAVRGSAPTNGDTEPSVVKAFRKDLAQHAKVARQQLREHTLDLYDDLGDLVHAHALGIQDTSAALLAAGAAWRATLADDAFWLAAFTGNPVAQARQALLADGSDDADASSDLVPDGDGAYARFLARLETQRARQARLRATLVARFVEVVAKQAGPHGESLAWTLRQRPLRPLDAPVLDVAQDADVPDADPQVVAGLVARVSDGDTSALLGVFAGLSPEGLDAAVTTLVEDDDDAVALDGLITDVGGAFDARVPALGDVPTLGWTFATRSDARLRASSLVLSTPVVDVGDR